MRIALNEGNDNILAIFFSLIGFLIDTFKEVNFFGKIPVCEENGEGKSTVEIAFKSKILIVLGNFDNGKLSICV